MYLGRGAVDRCSYSLSQVGDERILAVRTTRFTRSITGAYHEYQQAVKFLKL